MSTSSQTPNLQPSPQEAARELLDRRIARRNLKGFTEYVEQRPVNRAQQFICEQMDRVEAGEIDRLMLLAPPQHGKSEICSRKAPAYALGRNARHDIISASATAALAEGFGRDVRNLVGSGRFRNLFDIHLAEDTQAKGNWRTQEGGSYYAVGIGGALMGRGATRGIIDDPFASMEDAQSEVSRENVWDWYTGTFYNRIRPGGAIVLIQHRMHEEDLAGRLLAQQQTGGDKWTVIDLPAIGDQPKHGYAGPLWPERYDADSLARIKANTPPRYWSSLYMQQAIPEEGTYFLREWFKDRMYDPKKLTDKLSNYMTSDFAVTEAAGDYTSLGVHGWDQDGDLYLARDYWGGKTSPDVWIDEACTLMKKNAVQTFFGEAGVIRRSVEPFLIKRMQERNCNVRVEWLSSITDKPARARALQGRASMGKVWLPDNEAGHRILHQMLSFPGGKFDDDVDMCGMMGRAIDETRTPIAACDPYASMRRRA